MTIVEAGEKGIRISNNNRTNKHQLLRKKINKLKLLSSRFLLSKYMIMVWILVPIMAALIIRALTTPIMTIKTAMISLTASMPVAVVGESL